MPNHPFLWTCLCRRIATFGCALALVAPAAHALILVDGSVGTVNPNGLPIGTNSANLLSSTLSVGDWAYGRLTVDSGSFLSAGALSLADGATGSATLLLDGPGSRVELSGSYPISLIVGNWGKASMTVSGGAVFQNTCTIWSAACITEIGGGSGSDSTLTITGAGSSFTNDRNLYMGTPSSWPATLTAPVLSTPLPASQSRLEVLAGAQFATDSAFIAAVNMPPDLAALAGPAHAVALISGTGSVWHLMQDTRYRAPPFMAVGGVIGNDAELNVLDGGKLIFDTSYTGPHGSLNIFSGGAVRVDGAGSSIDLNGASLLLGTHRNSTVSGGGRINQAFNISMAGILNIDGAGSVVEIDAPSTFPGGGPAEATAAWAQVGWLGEGHLNVTQGGKLLLQSQVHSTVLNQRATTVTIGGYDANHGGASNGYALVSGVGSEISLQGDDRYMLVGGLNAATFGQLTISDSGRVSATQLTVGRQGTGVLALDHGFIDLSGQFVGGAQNGAAISLGNIGGTATASLAHGSVINLTNFGSNGATFSMGGFDQGPLARGSLSLTGASSIKLTAAPGAAVFQIARYGMAEVAVSGASSIDVGDGRLYVGRFAGSTGTLRVVENSTITAGWVGIARNRVGAVDTDGGTGLVVIDDSTLTAANVVIGSQGMLCGNGRVVANVIDWGVVCPGDGVGTMTINGGFAARPGGKLVLDVMADGHGGFVTDRIVFGAASAVDLSGLKVEFHFLGATDPRAFLASGKFDIGNFVAVADGQGGTHSLGDSLFDRVGFSATADSYSLSTFSYSASGGATFAIPEPASPWLLAAGLSGLLFRRRKVRADARFGPAHADAARLKSYSQIGTPRFAPPKTGLRRCLGRSEFPALCADPGLAPSAACRQPYSNEFSGTGKINL